MELLTTKEVMEKLKVSRITLLRFRKARKIKSINIGRKVMYNSVEIQKLMHNGHN